MNLKKNTSYYLLLALPALLFFVLPAKAQTVPAGLDERLRHTLDSMQAALGTTSLSAAIQFADGAVWTHARGTSSLQPAAEVTPGDAYLIGSVTKTLTSACILQLADEGLLHLDDSLHAWLDTLPYINPDITIRQLLQHTSGLADVLAHPHHQDSMMADVARVWTARELIDRFMAPPSFQPGVSWAYCNTNYFLLGMIIEQATGNPFYTELRRRFFTPLGLASFAIPSFEPLSGPVAHVWIDLDGDQVQEDAHDFYMAFMALNSSAGAAGGYFATPADCSRWMRAYMRGDLLSAAMMAEARSTVHAPGSQGGRYGLGLMRNQTDFLSYEGYGHGGDLAYHASSWYFPEKDAAITVFNNDNSKNSWLLLPVVRELLRTYTTYDPTSIAADRQPAPPLNAYPIPFSDRLNLECRAGDISGTAKAVLSDISGRVLRTQTFALHAGRQHHLCIGELDGLPKGVYLLTLHVAGRPPAVVKVVK